MASRRTYLVLVLVGMSTSQNSNFFLLSPSPLTFSDDPHVYSLINLHCNFGKEVHWVPATYIPPACNLIT